MKTILEVDEVDDDEAGGDELSDVEDVFVGDEAELPKRVYYDARPSKEEVELHDLTHLPYRTLRQRQGQETSSSQEETEKEK